MAFFDMSPQDQGLLAAAFSMLANSGPSALPRTLGQSVGQAGMAGMQGAQSAQQSQFLNQLREAQILEAKLKAAREAQQMAAMRDLTQAGQPQPLGPQAMAAGAQAGDIGPTQTNLKRLDALQMNPMLNQYTPIPLDKLQKAAAAGVNIEPYLKLNAAAQPKLEQVDLGGDVGFRLPNSPEVMSMMKKTAPLGAIPPELADLAPPQQRDFLLAKQRAGASQQAVNVNTQLPASEEAQRKFMDATQINYQALRNAPTTLKNIEEAKALIPQAKGFMGPGGEGLLDAAKFMNNRFGLKIQTEGIKSAEELRTRMFVRIMDDLKKMDAQPSQMQQQMMQDALGKLGTDPNALPQVLDVMGDLVRGKVEIHNKEVEGAIQRGVKFPYDPKIALEPPAPKTEAPKAAIPKRGDVVDGWEFLGGDPANKMSWRKR